nr:MAG TPA: hypothetical protein [Caudoviricetes sp.]
MDSVFYTHMVAFRKKLRFNANSHLTIAIYHV